MHVCCLRNCDLFMLCCHMQVVDVVSVSCMKLHLRDNNVEKLKKTLYEIATHLQLARDGQTCEYNYCVCTTVNEVIHSYKLLIYMYPYNLNCLVLVHENTCV